MLEVPLRAEFSGEGARGGDGVGRVGRGVHLVLWLVGVVLRIGS
jgi:hypothetical protein